MRLILSLILSNPSRSYSRRSVARIYSPAYNILVSGGFTWNLASQGDNGVTFSFLLSVRGFVLLALVSSNLHVDRAAEPYSQGRSLTSWLNDLAYGRFPDMEKHSAASKAIREIGPDAIPLLMIRLTTVSEEPVVLLNNDLKRQAQLRQDLQTASAFRAIGPVAHAEIPRLIALLAPQYDAASESSSEPDYWLKYRSSELAGIVLTEMGAAGVAPLLETLEKENPKIRFGVVGVLEGAYRRSKDDRIIPAVLRRLRDEDEQVRWISARVLGSTNVQPETCVPALAERVRNDPEVNVRCYALMALKKFGRRAKAAIPEVLAATSDKNNNIRAYARETFQAIQVKTIP